MLGYLAQEYLGGALGFLLGVSVGVVSYANPKKGEKCRVILLCACVLIVNKEKEKRAI